MKVDQLRGKRLQFGSGTAGKSTNPYNGVAGGYDDLSRKSRKRRTS